MTTHTAFRTVKRATWALASLVLVAACGADGGSDGESSFVESCEARGSCPEAGTTCDGSGACDAGIAEGSNDDAATKPTADAGNEASSTDDASFPIDVANATSDAGVPSSSDGPVTSPEAVDAGRPSGPTEPEPTPVGPSSPSGDCALAPALDWTPIAATDLPLPGTSVWTIPIGNAMFAWGPPPPERADEPDLGVVYWPCEDRFTSISSEGAPQDVAQQSQHRPTSVWTGVELLVWGGTLVEPVFTGYQEGTEVYAASRYDVAAEQWRDMNRTGEPLARDDAVTLWTGSELLVWGGVAQSGDQSWANHSDGALYDPTTDSWRAMSMQGAPEGRDPYGQTVWTGTKLVVWGGLRYDTGNGFTPVYTTLSDGATYDVATDSWTPIPSDGAPTDGLATLVWTGDEVYVLAQLDAYSTPGELVFDAAAFDPETNTWSPLPAPDADLVGQVEAPGQKVWFIGGKLVVVAERLDAGPITLIFDPASNAWSAADMSDVPNFFTWRSVTLAGDLVVASAEGPMVPDARGALHRSTTVSVFDPNSATWTNLPTLESRTLPALVPLEGQLIAWRGSDVYDDLDAPDPCEGSTQACDPTTPTITEELSDGLRIDLSQFGY